MVIVRFCLALVAALGVGFLCMHCAPVHDATPVSCPSGQEPSGATCVCVATQAAPVQGECLPPDESECDVADCIDDGNPCTEPTCLSGADTCTNEPVANATPCDLDGVAASCVSGICTAEPPPEWKLGTPFVIGGGGGEIVRPQIAVDANGNAVVIWSEDEALMACTFDSEEGWGEPEMIEEQFEPDRGFAIDADADGNAIVVYARIEQGSIDIRAQRFDSAIGIWSASEVLSRDEAVASAPRIVVISQGDAVATWWEAPGAILLARTATDRLTWDEPVVVSPEDGFDKGDPYVSMTETGKGAIIYSGGGSTGPAERVWVQVIDEDVGSAVEIDASNAEVASTRIAAAGDGELMAVWVQESDVWHSHFVGGQWSQATVLETASDSVGTPEVASADSGVFFAVWPQSLTIRARLFTPEGGWSDTTTPRTDGATRPPSLIASPSGDAWILWHEDTSIVLRSYSVESGWGAIETISSDIDVTGPSSHRVDFGRAPDGTLIAVWDDGTNVYAWADAR